MRSNDDTGSIDGMTGQAHPNHPWSITSRHKTMKLKILSLFSSFALMTQSSFGQQSSDHAALATRIAELRATLNAVETDFLAPSAQDRFDYSGYLNVPDRGLIRLLPGEKYDQPNSLTIRGGGSYYSFFHLTQEYNFGSDIQLRDGGFKVGFAGMDYGFFGALGNQQLEDVLVDSPGVAALAQYMVPSSTGLVQRDQGESGTGLNIGGQTYADHIKAAVNQTYLLRSINYDRSDVLVAFRVVREDTDGSLIITWKMLRANSIAK